MRKQAWLRGARARVNTSGTQLGVEALETRDLLSVTTAVTSGAWDSPGTWSAGVPDDTLRAIIPSSHTVTLTGDDHVAKEIVVQGVLTVAESPGIDKSLTADWIHVNSGGVFQIGSQFNRYDTNEFVVTLTGDDPNASFSVEGAGTIVNNNAFLMAAGGGRLQFFGDDKLTFTKLAQTAEVGANQIVVEAFLDRDFDGDIDLDDGFVNWEVGDQIVIASSTSDYNDEEVRHITATEFRSDGTVLITLDAPLNERHYGEIERYTRDGAPGDFNGDGVVDAADYTVWRDHLNADTDNPIGGAGDDVPGVDFGDYAVWRDNLGAVAGPDFRTWEVDMRAEVAVLNRNVRIQGLASQDTDNEFGDRARFNAGLSQGFGAHTMIMPSAGQITIDSVQFDKMGQTARQGRYPIHWHLAGDRTGDVLRGASVTNSNNRGVTVHGTHNLLIEDVVLHDIHGHGFFIEDAVETGNQFLANIAFGIHKVGRSEAVGNFAPDLNDPFIVDTHDHVGQNGNRFLSSAAYWITNPDNTFIGNISAGSEGTGFWFILPDSPIGAAANDPQYNGVRPDRTNLGQFDHNSSHASPIGLNFDRGSDLEVPVGGNIKAFFDGDEWRPPQEPQINYYTAYQHRVGNYHRGQIANFHENRYVDNFTSTFITFTQRVTDTLYVGHSRGNADLGDIVTGHTIYDGASTLTGNHFAGFTASNAHTFRTHNAANRFTSHLASGTTFEDDGTANAVSIAAQAGTLSGGTFESHNVFGHSASAIYDVDGTLTGHVGGGPGYTVVTDHPFFYDSGDIRPAGWNAVVSDELYAQVLFNIGANFVLTSPDGDAGSPTYSNYNTHVKANDGDYAVSFPSGVGSVSNGFRLKYFQRVGPSNGSTVFRFEGLGGVLAPQGATQLGSVATLRNAGSTAYAAEGGDLWVKFFSSSNDVVFGPAPTDPPPIDGLPLSATDDAYLQQTATFNDTLLRVESSASRTRTSYLKFDVPDSPDQTITGATLRLTVSGDAGNGMRIRVYEGGSDAWTETTLTPANAPAKATLLDEITGNFVIGQTYEFDVSGAVVAGEQVSFVIDSDGGTSAGDAAFASSENGNAAIRPLLIVELEDPPADTLWVDNDPASGDSGFNAGLSFTTVSGAVTGDASRAAIGQVTITGDTQYGIITPGDIVIPSQYRGTGYELRVDYYIPPGTTLDAPDLLYVQQNFNGVNTASSGFVGEDEAGTGWQTIILTGTVPGNTNDARPAVILADGGIGTAPPNGTGSGVALYLDNISFTVGLAASSASQSEAAAFAALTTEADAPEPTVAAPSQAIRLLDDRARDEALLLIDPSAIAATEEEDLLAFTQDEEEPAAPAEAEEALLEALAL